MPDYSSLTSQITQFKTAASALMTSGTLSPNDLQLVGAALNSIGNTLGVADINNAVVDGIATINTNRDAAITSFNTSTNGQRLTNAEADITVLEGKVTNIEGFVATNSTQYTTLQSTVSALQTSIATVPSAWAVQNTSYTAVNGIEDLLLHKELLLLFHLDLRLECKFSLFKQLEELSVQQHQDLQLQEIMKEYKAYKKILL